MKRRIPHLSAPSIAKPLVNLVDQGRLLLEGGRWREAVETYKQLVKQDPTGGWEASLAISYEGRAEELAGKGMFKEALILLDNAEHLGAKPGHLSLRLNCLMATGGSEQVASLYMRQEASLQAALPTLFPVVQEYVAVFLLTKPAMEQSLPTDSPWRGWLTVARDALTVLSSPADLEPLLGRISLRSPFKPLRLILKALSLIRDQPDKALQLVAVIADTSPWSGLRRIVTLACMDWEALLQPSRQVTSQEMAIVCAWRGVPLASWLKARELLAASQSRFLTILLDPAVSWSPSEQQIRRLAWFSLVENPSGLPHFQRRFGVLDNAEKARLVALSQERSHPHGNITSWYGYLRQLEALPESADRNLRKAMTHRHMAALIAEEDHEDPTIVNHLERSLEFDPTHRKSYKGLLAWHKNEEDDKACRQVLDRALVQFPDDADFLHEAVRESLKNKTFKKASRLAKRLLAIDPLHGGVRKELVGACLAQARKQVRSSRLDLAAKELVEAASWQRPDDRDGLVTLNQAFLAWLSQRQEEGDLLLEQGVTEAGGGVAARLRASLEGSLMGLSTQWLNRLRTATKTSIGGPASRQTVLAVVGVARDYGEENSLNLLLTDLSDLFNKAVGLDYSQEEMRAICYLLAQARVYAILTRYATLGEKKWRDQPVFSYFRLLGKYRGLKGKISQADLRHLKNALHQAKENNDRELVDDIEEWLWETGDLSDFEENPFDGLPMPRFGGMPMPDPRDMFILTMCSVAEEFMTEQGGRATRASVRGFLNATIDMDAAPPEVKRILGNTAALMEEILDQVFSVGGGSPRAGNKPKPTPSPAKRPQQLELNLDDDP